MRDALTKAAMAWLRAVVEEDEVEVEDEADRKRRHKTHEMSFMPFFGEPRARHMTKHTAP